MLSLKMFRLCIDGRKSCQTKGWVSEYGIPLQFDEKPGNLCESGEQYQLTQKGVVKL